MLSAVTFFKALSKKAFTLTEILIALAILGVLGAVLFSSTIGSNDKAKRITARDSLIELSKALQAFERDSNTLPTPVKLDGTTEQSNDYVGFLSAKSSLSSNVGKYKTDKNGIILINNEPVFYTRDITNKFFVIGVNTVEPLAFEFELIPSANAAGMTFITETNFNGAGNGNILMGNSGSEMPISDTNQTAAGFISTIQSPSQAIISLTKTGTTVPTFTLTKSDGTTENLTVKNIDGTTATSGNSQYLVESPTSSFKIDSKVTSSELAFSNYIAPAAEFAAFADSGSGSGGSGGSGSGSNPWDTYPVSQAPYTCFSFDYSGLPDISTLPGQKLNIDLGRFGYTGYPGKEVNVVLRVSSMMQFDPFTMNMTWTNQWDDYNTRSSSFFAGTFNGYYTDMNRAAPSSGSKKFCLNVYDFVSPAFYAYAHKNNATGVIHYSIINGGSASDSTFTNYLLSLVLPEDATNVQFHDGMQWHRDLMNTDMMAFFNTQSYKGGYLPIMSSKIPEVYYKAGYPSMDVLNSPYMIEDKSGNTGIPGFTISNFQLLPLEIR